MTTTEHLVLKRINAGHSIRGLARELGISEHVVRRIETGQPVRPESAKPLADFYGVTVAELIGVDERVA